jgi:LysR family transcriptional regulator, glycine cleavage system transcriptional activator
MSDRDTALIRNLPSMKALLFFNTVARHLNLVRAGEELHLTQGALSRQLKTLEDHLGVTLFHRGPRGLTFTQEGEILYDYSRRAFDTLSAGLRHLSVVAERETLVVSVARSFAIRVLAGRISGFVRANPWVDLRVDIHRYFADLESSGADISIRLGDGQWEGHRFEAVSDDVLWLVAHPTASPAVLSGSTHQAGMLLTNTEREYNQVWVASGRRAFVSEDTPTIRFNDSATMLEAVHAGAGFCVTRASLVREAVAAGTLARIGDEEMNDGLRYYALCARRSSAKKAVDLFMQWLAIEFRAAAKN